MATTTSYVYICNRDGLSSPAAHTNLILKATADTILGTLGYVECPICHARNPSAVVTANQLTSTT